MTSICISMNQTLVYKKASCNHPINVLNRSSTVSFNGKTSEPFTIQIGVKHGCVLRLESFHLRYLRRILGITWQDTAATCIAWAMATSQKMYCMGSWQQDTTPQAAWHCISRMSASVILNLQTLNQLGGTR